MKCWCWWLILGALCGLGASCQSGNFGGGRTSHWPQFQPLQGAPGRGGVTASASLSPPSGGASNAVSMAILLREIRLRQDLVARGTHGRKVVRRMSPAYITIHSTANYSAGAAQHALALKRGTLRSGKRPGGNRIGYLIWHFTADDREAIQHLPTSEQGEHADYNGPGNRSSIGIEMCENRGGNRSTTVERTAKLAAVLMVRHRIPLRNVVPHYHWPRWDKHPPHKNCPSFLLDNGRPGAKWRAFQNRVNFHYRRLTARTA